MRLLIVEDDPGIATFLKKSFEAEAFAVDVATDGEQGSYVARTNAYDVIILDNMLPKKVGLDVCRDIRKNGQTVPIIMLSVRSEIPEKVTLFNAGIDDYVTKPYSFDELLARVYARLRGEQTARSVPIEVGDLIIDSASQEVRRGGREIYLTRKEFALLELLARNKGKVVSRGTIMEHVWDMNADPLSRTIDMHIANLRKKIDLPRKPALIRNVPGRGYRLSPR
jgi:two-component system copper resistance phosphate regulon response regulator CusR